MRYNNESPYGHFKTSRSELFRYILELVFDDSKDSLELIYNLKVNIANFLVKAYLEQPKKGGLILKIDSQMNS